MTLVEQPKLSQSATSLLFKLASKQTQEAFIFNLHNICGYWPKQRPYNFVHLPWKQLAVVNFVSNEECVFCFHMVQRVAGTPSCPIADLREGMHTGLHENLAYFCAKCSMKSVYETLPLVWVSNQEVTVEMAVKMFVTEELLQSFVEKLTGRRARSSGSARPPRAPRAPLPEMKAAKTKGNKIPTFYSQTPDAMALSEPPFLSDAVDTGGSAVVINL